MSPAGVRATVSNPAAAQAPKPSGNGSSRVHGTRST